MLQGNIDRAVSGIRGAHAVGRVPISETVINELAKALTFSPRIQILDNNSLRVSKGPLATTLTIVGVARDLSLTLQASAAATFLLGFSRFVQPSVTGLKINLAEIFDSSYVRLIMPHIKTVNLTSSRGSLLLELELFVS